MRFKVVYHVGGQIDPKTKLSWGRLTIAGDSLSLSGASPLTVPFSSITAVELLRPHPRFSLMVRVLAGSSTVFMSALFFRFFWDVFVCDQDATIRVYDVLQSRLREMASA